MTAITDFGDVVAALGYDQLGDELLDAARRRVFDTIGATAVGLATEDGKGLRRLTERMGTGSEPSVTDAIRLYVSATRATEVDDINIASCTTVGSVVVPVAAAVATRYGGSIDDRRFLAAVVAGYEAMVRLGTAIDGAVVLYRGIWPTYVTGPFTAAAVGARLLGLDGERTANALALALSRSTAIQARTFRGMSPRWYVLGCAAAEGFVAAQAAAAGIGGDVSILGAFGKGIGAEVDEAVLLEGLGSNWRILDMDTKPFPTSRQGLSSVEAFMQQTPLKGPVEEIEIIDVFVPAHYRAMIERAHLPRERMESIGGVAYQMALAAVEPARLYDDLRTSLRLDEPVATLVSRVRIHEDPELTAAFPRQWGGRVRTRWRSGEEIVVEVRAPRGAATRPFGWDELKRKLDTVLTASGIAASGSTQALLDRCGDLGKDSGGTLARDLLRHVEQLSGEPSPSGGTA